MRGFPVLMYHALSDAPTSEYYTLARDDFARQMSTLAELGLYGTSLAGLRENAALDTNKAVVLSFDDGHISNLRIALPILEKFSFSATFFITTDRIGRSPDWMSWADAKELLAAGMDIQAHGHTHAFLNDLSGPLQHEELNEPKRLIEERLGTKCTGFSFPGGRYDGAALKLARELGYEALCTSEPGLNSAKTNGQRPMLIKRFVVHQGLGEQSFRRIVRRETMPIARANIMYNLKRTVKRALGNRLYHKVWSVVFGKRGG